MQALLLLKGPAMNPFHFMRLAATLDLGLVAAELGLHWDWLPLGGGHAEQLVLVFVATYVVVELILTLREARKPGDDDKDPK